MLAFSWRSLGVLRLLQLLILFLAPIGRTGATAEDPNRYPWRQHCTLGDRIPHEYYCDIYYQCVASSSNSSNSSSHIRPPHNQWLIQQCSDMYHYSAQLHGCELFWLVGCNPSGDKPIVVRPVDCPRRQQDYPVDGKSIYLAHANCRRYYRCDRDQRPAGVALELQCSEPLHWDRNRDLCMQPGYAGCVADSAAEPANVDRLPAVADARCQRGGLADSWTMGAHPVLCDHWWQCDRGVVQWKRCPQGEMFVLCKEQCAAMAEARCVEGGVERRNEAGEWQAECPVADTHWM